MRCHAGKDPASNGSIALHFGPVTQLERLEINGHGILKNVRGRVLVRPFGRLNLEEKKKEKKADEKADEKADDVGTEKKSELSKVESEKKKKKDA